MALRGTLTHRKTVWKPGYFYAMRRDIDGAIKFGISIWPEERLRQIGRENRHGSVSLIWVHKTESMRDLELRVHRALEAWRISTEKEWFRVTEAYAATLLLFLQKEVAGG